MSQGFQTFDKAIKKASAKKAQMESLQPEPSHEFVGECSACHRNNGILRKASQTRFDHDFSRIPVHPISPTNIQAKLRVSPVGDLHEQEADRIAYEATARPSNTAISGISPRIQRYTGQKDRAIEAPISVDRVLASPGMPLDPMLRQDMEHRLRYDFSQVRVHSNAAAEQSAQEINAKAYTAGHNIVFGAGRFAPGRDEGRRLIAHELTHVVQQSTLSQAGVQRQAKDDNKDQPKPNMMRLYSFGPTGAGRVAMTSGVTIFSPAAPVDAKGNELVRAGTPDQPKLSRFGRYFTLDERHRLYPPPVPPCTVKAITEWHPDDGSAPSKDQKEDDATRYYAPGEPLGTKLGTEYIFPNDRPGILTMGYVFTAPDLPFLLMSHGVHFVNDPSAPIGATVLDNKGEGQGPVAIPEARAATDTPAKIASDTPGKKPESKGTPMPPSPSPQKAPPEEVGQIKEITELIKKASDAATKDALVSKLRDLFAKIQPFIPAKDAKKMIDEAIRSLVKDAADDAIMAILKAVTGKSPTTMPENRSQTGPDVPQKDIGEHIIQGPKITIKDAPAPAPRSSFEYRNGPQRSYEPGAIIRFTLVPPDNFSSLQGAKRLVIVAEADRNVPNPERFARIDLESASPRTIEVQSPKEPGKYVFRVDIGMGFDYSSVQAFEVTAPKK